MALQDPPPLPPAVNGSPTQRRSSWLRSRQRIALFYLMLALGCVLLHQVLLARLHATDWIAKAAEIDPSGFFGIPMMGATAMALWGLSWYSAMCAVGMGAAGLGFLSWKSARGCQAIAIAGFLLPPVGVLAGIVALVAMSRARRTAPAVPPQTPATGTLPLPR